MLILFGKPNLQVILSLVDGVVVTSWPSVLLRSFKHVLFIYVYQLVSRLRILAGSEGLLVHAGVGITFICVDVSVEDSLRISVRCNWSHLYLARVRF